MRHSEIDAMKARHYQFDSKGIVSDIFSLQVFRIELTEFLHKNEWF